ncbi:hypothetical protein [Arthrobacter sp. L77]|uniref:hypothetical protein n=1 Tax=Arthrobacter sp. L77 TaxID=1496689 RepID=UPI0005B949ED|nr:hypothetical protein [Arthrobacter sp. L77]
MASGTSALGAESDETMRRRAMAMHPSASNRKLKILVSADAEAHIVQILVHGCVSAVNLHALDLVVRRAATLSPGTNVVLDLSEAQAWDSVRADLHPESITARLTAQGAAPAPFPLGVIPPAP